MFKFLHNVALPHWDCFPNINIIEQVVLAIRFSFLGLVQLSALKKKKKTQKFNKSDYISPVAVN